MIWMRGGEERVSFGYLVESPQVYMRGGEERFGPGAWSNDTYKRREKRFGWGHLVERHV